MQPTPEDLKKAEELVLWANEQRYETHGNALKSKIAQALADERQRAIESTLKEVVEAVPMDMGVISGGENDLEQVGWNEARSAVIAKVESILGKKI